MVVSISRAMNAEALETYHSKDNYYSEGEGLENSQWYGAYAEQQGLSGQITAEEWSHACKGEDPNGNALRRNQANSRAGWDMTFSASKSISLKALVDRDDLVLEAHREAVLETVDYIEQHCLFSRTKHAGVMVYEQTQSGQFALFEHDDNRNQDPQLHTHVVAANQTLCADGKSRTLDSREFFRQQKTIGAYYDHSFAARLSEKGFVIDWTGDHTFEISGYQQEHLDSFSSRRQEIKEYLESQGIGLESATSEQKQVACLESRGAKVHKLSEVDHVVQRETWQQACDALGIVHPQADLERDFEGRSHPGSLTEVIDQGIESATAQRVAVSRGGLLRECLRHSQEFYRPSALAAAIDQRTDLIELDDGRLTTHRGMEREQWILDAANRGQDQFDPLSDVAQIDAVSEQRGLNPGQASGLKHIALSTDQVVLLQGDAGVGKTYTMNAFRECLDDQVAGQLRGLAPSAAAASLLEDETTIPSSTVDRYLLTPEERLERDQVLIVDEAGMLSLQQMEGLLSKSQALNNRLILVGDTKQLSAVDAGAPFRLLQERSELRTGAISENLRQQTPELKRAVDLAAQLQTSEALSVLDKHGCIDEVRIPKRRNQVVADRFLGRSPERQSETLVLCDTNSDRQEITEQIRSAYVDSGVLGAESRTLDVLRAKNLDAHGIEQIHNYAEGDMVRFQRKSTRFPEQYYRVTGKDEEVLQLQGESGAVVDCPVDRYRGREVYSVEQVEVRVGDRMRFTRNVRDWGQINGQGYQVTGFEADGGIAVQRQNGKSEVLSAGQLMHSDYAYCRTVYSAQGWTAKEAIWAPGEFTSQENTYVALSRAKHGLEVVTVDRVWLGLNAEVSRGQENVLDLMSEPEVMAEPEWFGGFDLGVEFEEENDLGL